MKQDDYPALYRSADALSLSAQRRFFSALRFHLAALVIAAALSVGWIPHWGMAVAQLATLLFALGCSIYLFTERPERVWYAGRAVAESVKTITWRYVCKAEPFFTSDSQARTEFHSILKKIVEQNREVCSTLTEHLGDAQISQRMNELRAATLDQRKRLYKDERVNDQKNWYANKARQNKITANRFFWGLIAVNGLAVLAAIFRIVWVEISFWPTDILVALAASILSWMQARRYTELAASYALAAYEIGFVSAEADRPMSNEEFSKYVGDAENAFSREHTQWIARKDV